MKKFWKYTYRISLLLLGLAVANVSSAQGIGNPCDTQNPDIYCPVDGGVWALVIGALVYGFMKIRKYKKGNTAVQG